MSLKFIIGGSGSGKTTRLYTDLIRQSVEEPQGRYFALVPEQFTMQTQKEIVCLHPCHGVMNIDIVSFERLAYRVFEELAVEDLAVLDDMGKSMVLRKVAAGVKKDLRLFGSHLDKAGFIGELKSMLSEFFQYGITEERLLEIIEETDSSLLRQKLLDMQVLYRAFQEYTEGRMIAKEELLELLCRRLPESKLIRGSVVTLDGYTGFTPVQYKLLELLFQYCKSVTVTVTMDPEEDPYREGEAEHLFSMSRHTICRLIDAASLAGCGREEDILFFGKENRRFQNSPELARIEQELFRFGRTKTADEKNANSGRAHQAAKDASSEQVFFYQAAAPLKEVEFLCGELSRLVRQEGYRYREIAVITGDLEQYSREILRQFVAHEIPCFLDDKKNILGNPMVELILAALEVLQKNFSYETVFRYLKTGLALPLEPEGYEKEREQELLSLAENYVLALGIRSFKRWNEPWEATYRGTELLNLAELNAFRETVLKPLLALRTACSAKNASVQEITEALVQFLKDLQIEEKLKRYEEAFHAAGEVSLEKEFSQVYGLVMDLFDRISALLGEEEVSRREYMEILDAGFAEIKVGLIPAVVDRVVVGDITRTRLSSIKVLFFLGVNEGIVPSVSGHGGILSEAERRRLKQQKVELAPTAREEGFLQRFYLYLALTKPSDRLYLTCAGASADGKALKPSVLIGQLHRLFPEKSLRVPDERKLAVWSLPLGLQWIMNGLKQADKQAQDSLFWELYQYLYSSEKYQDKVKQLLDAAFYSYQETGIGRTAAKALYSQILHGSVTRMEQYASCAYAHFLAYGLELSERPVYELAASDMGNLFHGAIDLYFKRMKAEGRSFVEISEADRKRLVEESVLEVAAAYGNTILKSSARNQYLEKKVLRITDRTIWALTEQLKCGDFEPSGFEVTFSASDHLRAMRIPLSAEEEIQLKGRIDRIDLCEDGDLLYLKIIDYKTGKTKFDLTELYYGLQLQLVVYLDAAVEKVQRRFPDKKIVPAGLFYYNIDDPMAERKEKEDEELTKAEILKKLRMNGLVNGRPKVLSHLDHRLGFGEGGTVESEVIPVALKNDELVERKSSAAGEAHFEALGAFVNRKLKTMGKEILDGKISISPYKNGSRTSCDYCPYHSVCGFDLKTEGFAFRRFDALAPEEIWEEIEAAGQKENREGNAGEEAALNGNDLDKGAGSCN